MTENKRYSEQNLENHLNRIYDNHEGKVIFDEEIVDLLNEQEEEIRRLKWSNKILRVNKKDCEFGRREERKRWVKMDEMRIEHIRLLQKRLKENGLSIYVNGDTE